MSKLIRSLTLAGVMMGLAAGGMTVAQEKAKTTTPTQKKTEEKKTEDKKTEDKKSDAKFEIYKDKGGKFRFRIFGKDGKQVGSAHTGYEKREDAVASIKAIQEMGSAPIVDQK